MTPARNEPCPCGSGKRFKHCCGQPGAPVAAPRTPAAPTGVLPAALPPADPHMMAALVGLVGEGRLEEAEARTRTLLHSWPAAGLLWKVLGVALMRQGKDALTALERAAELLPRDAEAHANLGSELHARQRWPAALESLRRSLTLESRNPSALIEAGDAQRALGNGAEALVLYGEALRLDPQRREGHNNLGNAYLELGRSADAVPCYRRALALDPGNPQVLCNLGNALRRLGDLEEALRCIRQAIALAPGLGLAHNILGLLLAARGQRAEAATCYREALRLEPRYPEALNNLGNVLRELGERPAALAAYREAVRLDPARADYHCNLGYALLEVRRPPDAAAAFRTAVDLADGAGPAQVGAVAAQVGPAAAQVGLVAAQVGLAAAHVGLAAAHVGLAMALRVQGRVLEAQQSCQAALAHEPHDARALVLQGELYGDRGQFTAAQDAFARALAVDADCAAAYASIAAHRRMSAGDHAWLAGVERLLEKSPPLSEEILLRYSLGKFFDDRGEFDRAFASYHLANELTRRHGAPYDGARLTALVDRIIGVCSATFLREPRGSVSASELPVFVIGMPRSGTSLTEQILASHHSVHGAGEVRFFDRAFALVQRQPPVGDAPEVFGKLARDYLARVSAGSGGALRVTDKMPANFLYAGLIHLLFPRARTIHLQRHALDTCLSVYFQNFLNVSPYANDLHALAHYYGEYLRICAHWRRVLPAASFLEVPYEGLVEDVEGWTRRMLDFIGLPWDPRCLDFHRTERVVITASRWQVRQQIHTASVGRWRHYEKHLAPLLPLLELAGAGAGAGAAEALA